MGKCTYCGESAGFLRSAHKECVQRKKEAERKKEAAEQQIRAMGKGRSPQRDRPGRSARSDARRRRPRRVLL